MSTLAGGADDFVPTAEWVLNLKEGDPAPNCFGNWRKVTRIVARGEDAQGNPFVVVNMPTNTRHGFMSQSFKAGRLHVTLRNGGRRAAHRN